MPHAQVSSSKIHAVLQSVTKHHRLTVLVRTMALEIERLEEDNTQLRAAVAMYREALRRYACRMN